MCVLVSSFKIGRAKEDGGTLLSWMSLCFSEFIKLVVSS